MTVDLRRAVAVLPDSLTGLRDRALILVGFAAALRRSELASLEVARREGAAWIEERPDGLVIHLGRSKTDQQAEGVKTACPMVRTWRRARCAAIARGSRRPA